MPNPQKENERAVKLSTKRHLILEWHSVICIHFKSGASLIQHNGIVLIGWSVDSHLSNN